MSTFSDLPRYPHESAAADRPADGDTGLRAAVKIMTTAGELLFLASPIFGCLWLVVSLPVLLALLVIVAARDERH